MKLYAYEIALQKEREANKGLFKAAMVMLAACDELQEEQQLSPVLAAPAINLREAIAGVRSLGMNYQAPQAATFTLETALLQNSPQA